MNKRNREQLRAAIANDLVKGQGGHSPTRELLRQYVPLEGIIAQSPPDKLQHTRRAVPVENSLAPHATVAPDATVARYAEVKGELRVPNTINFSLFPTLDPFAKAVYYQLFLLSHGFKRDRCIVGLARLAAAVLMSLRKVQDTVAYLRIPGDCCHRFRSHCCHLFQTIVATHSRLPPPGVERIATLGNRW